MDLNIKNSSLMEIINMFSEMIGIKPNILYTKTGEIIKISFEPEPKK